MATMLLSRAIALNNHAACSSTRESVIALRLALTTLRDKCQLGPCECEDTREFDSCRITSAAATTPMGSTTAFTNSVGPKVPLASFAFLDNQESVTLTGRDLESSATIIRRSRHSSSSMIRSGHGRWGESYLEVFDDLLMVSMECEVSKDLVAAVVLFNMAALRQTTGIHMNRSSMLMQAKNVYLMAMAILESFADAGGDVPALLLMVLFNNLAAIEAHFHGYNAMRYYLDCGRAVLSACDHGLHDADLALFVRNIMLPIPTVSAAA